MRFGFVMLLIIILGVSALSGCNSKDSLVTRAQKATQTPQPPSSPPADNARRIGVEELHKLWEKNEVLIIDPRAEPAYREEHIKGAISVPTDLVEAQAAELPHNKMIVAYCT